MTAKKKTLIELMLDAGFTPEKWDDEYTFAAQDERTNIDFYLSKPSFDSEDLYFYGNYNAKIRFTGVNCLAKNWKRTIITKQQFVDAYNEKHNPAHSQQKTLDEAFCVPITPLKVTVENNTQHSIHADLSDIDAEKFKREFHEAGRHCALTPDHYSVINGKDLIDRSAESYKTDEFRGAMRFNIEKYIDRLGKKDSLVKELRKIADYANRWADYEEKLQGSKQWNKKSGMMTYTRQGRHR